MGLFRDHLRGQDSERPRAMQNTSSAPKLAPMPDEKGLTLEALHRVVQGAESRARWEGQQSRDVDVNRAYSDGVDEGRQQEAKAWAKVMRSGVDGRLQTAMQLLDGVVEALDEAAGRVAKAKRYDMAAALGHAKAQLRHASAAMEAQEAERVD